MPSNKEQVTCRELIESEEWASTKAKLPLALGSDASGNAIIADLAEMPHLIVAGACGTGTTQCIHSIIMSLILRHAPENLRLIMIDPKAIEIECYNVMSHLLIPVIADPRKAILALHWLICEMDLRYRIFTRMGVDNVNCFNRCAKPKKPRMSDSADIAVDGCESPDWNPPIPDHMPFIVVIVDDFGHLMLNAPDMLEGTIARITRMGGAAGIHMVVATQIPSAEVLTESIKENIPTRIAFQVDSKSDSRVILDENGAERLLGQRDMLYLPRRKAKIIRARGALITDMEISEIVRCLGSDKKPPLESSIAAKLTELVWLGEEARDDQ